MIFGLNLERASRKKTIRTLVLNLGFEKGIKMMCWKGHFILYLLNISTQQNWLLTECFFLFSTNNLTDAKKHIYSKYSKSCWTLLLETARATKLYKKATSSLNCDLSLTSFLNNEIEIKSEFYDLSLILLITAHYIPFCLSFGNFNKSFKFWVHEWSF